MIDNPNSFRWKKETKYYKLIFQKDLFDGTNIVCVWGREGTDRGGYKIILCKDDEDIKVTIDKIKKRRKYRGYEQVPLMPNDLHH